MNILRKILPLTKVNIEDVKAKSKEGKRKWNISFSPLEVGNRNLGLELILTSGFQTSSYRKSSELFDSRFSKLDYSWNSHCVDSHCLVELALERVVNPN